jgi:uncharacterized membrane protein
MIIIRGFDVKTQKNVVDLGPLQVNKTENNWIGWPTYAGVIVSVLGIVLIVADKTNKA